MKEKKDKKVTQLEEQILELNQKIEELTKMCKKIKWPGFWTWK